MADDGIRYLNPEIGLLYKARLAAAQGRPRPRPLPGRCSTRGARAWLRDSVARLYPDHAWLALLS